MMKKLLLSVFAALVALTIYLGIGLAIDAKEIYEGTIRLHIIAESDSEADQAMKLKVRDALVAELAEWTAAAANKSESQAILEGHLNEIEAIAEAVLEQEGYFTDVQAVITEEYYSTREYDGVRLPAGRYTSLQVKIGKAEGKNWWCVLFPNLSTSSVKAEKAMVETGFSKNQIRLLTDEESPRYTLRFRIIESLSKLGRSLKEWFS